MLLSAPESWVVRTYGVSAPGSIPHMLSCRSSPLSLFSPLSPADNRLDLTPDMAYRRVSAVDGKGPGELIDGLGKAAPESKRYGSAVPILHNVTPLHAAAACGHQNAVALLLMERHGQCMW